MLEMASGSDFVLGKYSYSIERYLMTEPKCATRAIAAYGLMASFDLSIISGFWLETEAFGGFSLF